MMVSLGPIRPEKEIKNKVWLPKQDGKLIYRDIVDYGWDSVDVTVRVR